MGQEKLSKNRTDNEENKFIEKSDGTVAVDTLSEISNTISNPIPTNPVSGSLLQGVVFDAINASFPNTVTEVYEYYEGGLSGTLNATITVIYVDASKKLITSVVRS